MTCLALLLQVVDAGTVVRSYCTREYHWGEDHTWMPVESDAEWDRRRDLLERRLKLDLERRDPFAATLP